MRAGKPWRLRGQRRAECVEGWNGLGNPTPSCRMHCWFAVQCVKICGLAAHPISDRMMPISPARIYCTAWGSCMGGAGEQHITIQ